MAGETIITVVGNLTADPELRYTQNGLAVANFTIASTPRTFDRQANEWKDGEALFLRASVWREFAEHVAGSLTKGSRVIASGRLKQRSYETKEGEKRTTIELEVDEIGPRLRYATAQVTRAPSSRGGRWRRLLRGRPVRRAVGAQRSRSPVGAAAAATSGTRPAQLRRRDPLLIIQRAGASRRARPTRIHKTGKPMAGKSSGDRRKPSRGKGAKNAAPAKSDPRRRHRLQGCRHPSQVHLGAREDPRPSHHRCLRAGAAPHRPRRQERARDGPPALRGLRPLRSTTMAKLILTHEVTGLGTRRRRRRGQERLRPQLPHPPGLRRGVDPRWREAGRADQGRPRGPRARTRSRTRRPSRPSSSRARSSWPSRPASSGRLFGSVKTADVADAVAAAGLGELDKRKIEIPTPIKAVGEHEATVRLRDELTATITLQVVAAK